jgi:hypothetical protein
MGLMTRFALLFSLLAACADEDVSDGLPPAPPAGEWIQVDPGGATVCSKNTPFHFYVRGGRADRVIVDFQGGGACWNGPTCSLADGVYQDDAGSLDVFTSLIDAGALSGIFDPDPISPFADWTIVHIPYCTGDIHWGNSFQDYGNGITIEHRGYVNASAALDWVYSRYPNPETVFVSGCSAGAYGAALHSAYIADHYRDARIALLADSGSGIVTRSFLDDSLPNWNAGPGIPPFIEALQRPLNELTLPDLYAAIAAHFPQHRFAQTATSFDEDQIFYYTAMGGMPQDWPGMFRASIDSIEMRAPNFRAYVPPGSMHCVLPYDFFYTREVDGVQLVDWVEQLVTGAEMPASAKCEGAECCSDPVCDACAGSTEGPCRFCDEWPPSWSECATTM